MAHRRVLPCVGLLLAAGLAAQEPAALRVPHVGRVRGADGKPVADAVVTFVAARDSGTPGASDVVRATTDANGRFRLELLPTRDYWAWATAVRADGTFVTPRAERGSASTDLVFRATDRAAPTQLAVAGTEPWQAHGPLRVEIVVRGCAGLVPPATLGADASVPLPPLPDELAEAAVFAGGRFVGAMVTGLRGRLELPPPQRIPVRVQDDQGKPLTEVTVHRLASWRSYGEGPMPGHHLSDRHPVAVTDVEGCGEVLVAYRGDVSKGIEWPSLVFVANKAGFGESASGFSRAPFANGRPHPEAGATLSFTLSAQVSPSVDVQAAAGRMPRELGLLGRQTVPQDATSSTVFSTFVRAPVAEGGTCAMPATAKDWTLQAIHVPDQLPQLADDDPFRRAATPRTLVLPAAALTGPNGLDLGRMVPLRVQVLDTTSGPAMGAWVMCTPESGGQFVAPTQAMRARTDAAGRLVLPVMPGTWFVIVVHGADHAKVTLEVGAALAVQTLQLTPLDRMPVRVLDGDGKPLAGARFDVSGSSWRSPDSGEDTFLSMLGRHVAYWSMQQHVTDADGRATIPFLASRWVQTYFTVKAGARESQRQELRADDATTEIVVK